MDYRLLRPRPTHPALRHPKYSASLLLACTVAAIGWDGAAIASSDASVSPQRPSATELSNRGVTEAQAGRFEAGAQWLRQAVALDPHDATARKNLAGVLTDWALQLEREGQVERAIGVLKEAVQFDPSNGRALVSLGDVLYLTQSDIPGALQAWRQANGKVPAGVWPSVANRISQAQRDQLVERTFTSRRTAHFDIRLDPSTAMDLAGLEQRLEAAYARLARELGQGPSRLTVLVYSERDLRRLYYQRDWTIGFYDGRIRLCLDDLDQEDLVDLMAHELAHAFLRSAYGTIPIWIHEGYAQAQESARARGPEALRIEQGVNARTLWIPLKWLDRHFAQPSGSDDIMRAYVEARLVVRELIARYGMERFRAFLAQLSTGASVEAAYDQAFAPSRWARADQGVFD